jgi:hypothetical protein
MEIDKTFCNVGFDAETLAADILKGTIYSPRFLQLHEFISMIPMIPEVYQIQNILTEYQTRLLSKIGTIDIKETESFILGENPQMKEAFELLAEASLYYLDLYEQAIAEYFELTVTKLYENVQGQDFTGIAQAYNHTMQDGREINQMRNTQDKLEKIASSCRNIIMLYGSDMMVKMHAPALRVGNNKKYREYLFDLQTMPELFEGAIQVPICVVKAANTLAEALNIKNPLDPFELDQSECLLKVLTHPKKFYSYCKNNEIISTAIGSVFHMVYPEHYFYTYDIYLDSKNKLTFQEDLQFSKSFGTMSNYTNILTHPSF